MTAWTLDALRDSFAEMQARLVPPPSDDPVVAALMLVDLGQKFLNAVASTKLLGHTRLAHTRDYSHTEDPTNALVNALLDGRIEHVDVALERWRREGPAWLRDGEPA